MKNLSIINIIIAACLLLISCEKELNREKLPSVDIVDYSISSDNKLIVTVCVIDEGGSPVTERGMCYSHWNSSNEEVLYHDADIGTAGNVFQCEIPSSFICRAYAVNKYGTSYGKTIVGYWSNQWHFQYLP